MKIRIEQLASQLQKGLAPIYVLTGNEPLQLGEAADQVRSAAREAGYSNREIMEASSQFNWSSLMQEADSLSLFAEKKIIDLRISNGKPGKAGSDALCEYCGQIPEDTLLLVTLPKLEKSQLNSKWFKALDKHGITLQIWPPDVRQLPAWIRQRMEKAGLIPASEVTEMLAEQVEGNLLAASQEVEKLLLLYGPGEVSVEKLQGMIADSARYDVFSLIDAALAGNSKRCVRILGGLQGEGTPAPVVLWALARELRSLCSMANELKKGKSPDQAMSKARVWSSRKALVRQGLLRLKPHQWQQLLGACQEADAAVKGAVQKEPWLALEQIALGICGVDHPA